MKRIAILGIDGYIGYPLALDLLTKGYEVVGLDNGSRRARAKNSLTPIKSLNARDTYLRTFKNYRGFCSLTLGRANPSYIRNFLAEEKPDAIIHLAEQPSAPWSMVDPFNASDTQLENVLGTLHLLWCIKEECPDTHLIKLGTMGEYGTPDCKIPEGKIPNGCLSEIAIIESNDFKSSYRVSMSDNDHIRCPMRGLLFPRTPGSFYHASKVMDTINIEFACRNWELTSTDIMQGVVYGLMNTDPNEITRFDYDEYFGTCINRFMVQAINGYPMTIYGSGTQTRGWLPLKDSLQCINLIIENPPEQGTYRTVNQFGRIYSINELARFVQLASIELGINSSITDIPNPRNESEFHMYSTTNQILLNLGYKPTLDTQSEIVENLNKLLPFKDNINKDLHYPKTEWR